MKIVKPRNNTVIDIYKAWCLKKVREDSSLSLVYDTNFKRSGVKVLYQGRVCKPFKLPEKEGKIIMTYALFRRVLETYNQIACDMIIEGMVLQLGARLGSIKAKRLGRNFNTLRVNYLETKKARAIDSAHPVIYYTDDDYCKLAWTKSHQITNESFYSFTASKYKNGLRGKFKRELWKNPMLKYNYWFTPYRPSPQKLTA